LGSEQAKSSCRGKELPQAHSQTNLGTPDRLAQVAADLVEDECTFAASKGEGEKAATPSSGDRSLKTAALNLPARHTSSPAPPVQQVQVTMIPK
jgi:hypothetical protein